MQYYTIVQHDFNIGENWEKGTQNLYYMNQQLFQSKRVIKNKTKGHHGLVMGQVLKIHQKKKNQERSQLS